MNIRDLRKSKKMTAEQVAASLDMKPGMIYAYEQGRAKPSPDFLERFSVLMGVNKESITYEPAAKQEPVSPTWLQGLVDEYREKERRYLDQIEKLTNMLAAHLGKFEVSERGLNPAQMEISFSNFGGFVPETEKRKIAA